MSVVNESRKRRRLIHSEKETRRLDLGEEDDLELFQKEAAWRRSREYEHLTVLEKKLYEYWESLVLKLDHYVAAALENHEQSFEELEKITASLYQPDDNLQTLDLSLAEFSLIKDAQNYLNKYASYFQAHEPTLQKLAKFGSFKLKETPNVHEWIDQRQVHFTSMINYRTSQLKLALLKRKLSFFREALNSAELEWKRVQQDQLTSASERSIENIADDIPASEPKAILENGEGCLNDNDNISKLKNNFQSQADLMQANINSKLDELSQKSTRAAQLYVDIMGITDERVSREPHYLELKGVLSSNEEKIESINRDLSSLFEDIQFFISQRTKRQKDIIDLKLACVKEKQQLIKTLESSLTQIRNERDSLVAKQQMQYTNNLFFDDMMLLLSNLSNARVAILEGYSNRLCIWDRIERSKTGEMNNVLDEKEEISASSALEKLIKNNSCLEAELPSMYAAFDQSQSRLLKKYEELETKEKKALEMHYEKARATQKYFAAMKARDILMTEKKTLKLAENKEHDYIGKLQEREHALTKYESSLKAELEVYKQIKEIYGKHSVEVLTEDKHLQVKQTKLTQKLEDLIESVQKSGEKLMIMHQKLFHLQEEHTILSIKASYNKKESHLINQAYETQEAQVYKGMLKCSVCNFSNWKSKLIPNCGHAFCSNCMEPFYEHKTSTCPQCETPFSVSDILTIHL
ncbi:histone H2B-K119 ubiquitin ligase complex (HULC) subunit, ubiquitin-protein ligase E3 Brl1 [Schizosaccharomyces pombe]|uniref:E3 ubiquitin-protein ligase brl1 n=1 Tax=Schizosaccharomyces pombe (strain 972 / ATCC 24843) TaxID=284812 RepID=BRL1_SCHPO|nr:ubiquitin-protein ligase E3 Brl1 [Schizosaccharomyces pombe]Q1MTQ0.1 RecName: Full=E3 ubiquitin-protein ligase brl1; AltName: Full=BRE1-like protein 1; AltName: Full=RING finger protein 2; AltName: Full=RING-type E3 ubiquitin transferase brl1 [Schizosaccharomyces pombe 972h-]CAA22646.1 ubiquitin-protein ligase E3 Brl1 [Schizosaccharomyces pombe]|eukprot:NP_588497.1 ubiquitin-protein ligase E3 Brl1 [Schizosaccharomyces pombe]